LTDLSGAQTTILVLYYAFTSLTTVGLGDLHPRSNIERLFVAIILLLGVAVFSYIMGNLTDIIGQMSNLNTSFNEDENLCKFFSMLKKFNYN
jgi:hypothetical protein